MSRFVMSAGAIALAAALAGCGSVPRWQAPSGTGSYNGAAQNVPTYN